MAEPMSTLTSKVKYGLWFFKKGYYSQFLFMLNKVRKERTREEAVRWCKLIEISEDEVLDKLNIPRSQIEIDHHEFIEYARSNQNKCPYLMGRGGSLNVLYSIIKTLHPRYVVETGVAYGWSSLAILLGNMTNEDARLWSTDMPYPMLGNENYVGCVIRGDLKNKWSLVRKPDISGLPEVLQECGLIDFFHYDSDKSYKGRMQTAQLIWDHLKMGGYFMSINIHNNVAFKDFCDSKNRDPIVFKSHNKYIGIIRK